MERLIGIGGIAAILGVAWLLSFKRRGIRWKPVAVGLALQIAFAVAVLKVPLVREGFNSFAAGAERLLRMSDHGARFLFGCLLEGEAPVVAVETPPAQETGARSGDRPAPYAAKLDKILFVKMLPPIIFFSALTSLLYYLGILQLVVKAMAYVMARFMGTSGAESLSAAGNTVLGQTEAPLLIRPHFARLTSSELVAVMVGGFATSAGGMLALYMSMGIRAEFLLAASLMAAPGSLVMAKILLPETATSLTAGTVRATAEVADANMVEAIASGTALGLRLALNVAAMLIAFLALVALANAILGWMIPGASLERILGWIFAPFAFLMGVPFGEAASVGRLLGAKIAFNEVIAYQMMGGLELSERTVAIASFALCGFANFGSIGIQIGGLGGIAPERRAEVARFGLWAMLGGTLTGWMTATIAGILI